MADFEAIKISLLPPTEIVDVNDLLVLDVYKNNLEYSTHAVRVGKVVDYITTLDLNFTGNLTFINTIQPPLTGTLDGIFDNLTIRESLTIGRDATVNGLYLDDLEDVRITNPLVGDGLLYKFDATIRKNVFVNTPLIPEAPKDGKIYARSDGQWVDITDCLKCPTGNIGVVYVVQVDGQVPDINLIHRFAALTPTADSTLTDVTYQWSSNSNYVSIANPTARETNITFTEYGEYNLTCMVSSITGNDSPQYGQLTVSVVLIDTSYVTTESREIIVSEDNYKVEYDF